MNRQPLNTKVSQKKDQTHSFARPSPFRDLADNSLYRSGKWSSSRTFASINPISEHHYHLQMKSTSIHMLNLAIVPLRTASAWLSMGPRRHDPSWRPKPFANLPPPPYNCCKI